MNKIIVNHFIQIVFIILEKSIIVFYTFYAERVY